METSVIHKSRNKQGLKQINQYVFLETIGRGSYGKVKLVRSENDNNLYVSEHEYTQYEHTE